MTFAVNVQGGTGAGKRRPLKERRWFHDCKPFADTPLMVRRNLTAYSCPDCGLRRPRPFPTNSTPSVLIER